MIPNQIRELILVRDLYFFKRHSKLFCAILKIAFICQNKLHYCDIAFLCAESQKQSIESLPKV